MFLYNMSEQLGAILVWVLLPLEAGSIASIVVVSSLSSLCRLPLPPGPWRVLSRLMGAFTELRDQVDAGLLSYPYSTRELVNVAKHLQHFPKDTYVKEDGWGV